IVITAEKKAAIDKIFSSFEVPGSAGGSIGIIHNGVFIYKNDYGFANLDQSIPNTDSTKFYIGSMSKQFTAAALLFLEEEGKVDLNDEVKKYLPSFPTYPWPVTLRHLLYHMSGLKDSNTLQLFQGVETNFEEVFTNKDLYQLQIRQKDLEFEPGTRHSYSNGGYIILAMIIEEVSGQTLPKYLEEKIFTPLSMEHTLMSDDHNAILKNRAISYWYLGNQKWERRIKLFDAYGDGGILTTVNDLLKWDAAFYEDKLGIKNFAQKMYTLGYYNNGKKRTYARALNIWEYQGHRIIQHNGGMLAYRADLARFPEFNLSIIALGNDSRFNSTWFILQIADLLLPANSKETQPTKAWSSIDSQKAKKLCGYYFFDRINMWNRISFSNDTLFFDTGGNQVPLRPSEEENVYFLDTSNEKLTFIGDSILLKEGEKLSWKGKKFDYSQPSSIQELQKYIGQYYSDELKTYYHFYQEGERLMLQINQQKPKIIYPDPTDARINWNSKSMVWIGFGMIRFKMKGNEISGFKIGNNRVSGVEFMLLK
ncbi:MAG: serine hydrolase domain-containing protein, partial [Bacteroidota bacterium]